MTFRGQQRDLREAVDRFDALLRCSAKEADFQRLFAECPYILSRTLPLRLEPSDIHPLGRPGRSEPDFVIYPKPGSLAGDYGIIEIKRPDSAILTRPRKGVVMLSRDAQTAVSQSSVYQQQLAAPTAMGEALLMLGSRSHIFIIMGLSSEIANKLGTDLYSRQVVGLLPSDCRLIPYDSLFTAFNATVPPRMLMLVPELSDALRAPFVRISTSAGTIVFELFETDAPKTVANFKKLAQEGFYDGLIFHRVIKDFMIQGGCPQGTGTGGPGYTFDDEFNEHKIVRGALAMANAGPNTNGSQFFVVTTREAPWLDGKHTVFGRVEDGMETVDAIERAETSGADKPLESQLIHTVVVGT